MISCYSYVRITQTVCVRRKWSLMCADVFKKLEHSHAPVNVLLILIFSATL